ncbi:MAG: hypothetical protein HY301_21450 [Verrucomicrobia bacterium]|nr:hypothetical protein [Verrucomicrobiota bacterium]
MTRREFLQRSAVASAAASFPLDSLAQVPGERPPRANGVTVLNPRARVPVGLIIDDSTCLVNLNRFAMPQFDEASLGAKEVYRRNWREWPVEIPDAFVRKFGEWCAGAGVKGKYSIVPYPACVGRLDRGLPGWTPRELEQSLELIRTLMLPNWDIHPEMVTHTRVIDLKTGHPYPEITPKFMENWEWTTGRSVDEVASYMAYALGILKNVGLPCEGITTPGGFGSRARPQLAQGTFEAVRSVLGAEIPHYFRDLFSEGEKSVAPIVQNAADLDGNDPRCVVHIIGCTGDWTGGWDNVEPGGVDKFITADLQRGRMVDVITRGEPALMLAHWTDIYHNGREVGFKIFQEVVKRLFARFDNLHWMKLSEVARYWAAKELTRIKHAGAIVLLRAPFACPDFTVRIGFRATRPPTLVIGRQGIVLDEVSTPLKLAPGKWCRDGEATLACFALPKGNSELKLN